MQLLDDGETGVPAPPTLSLSNCLFDSNSAILDGGAMSLVSGAVNFNSGAVSSNVAGGDGGGISVKVRRAW